MCKALWISSWLLLLGTLTNGFQPVHLDLYYETLCPDCTEFISGQMYPAWEKLKNTGIFTLKLYPFGNAREFVYANGTLGYKCQHGDKECRGNFLEACVIKVAFHQFLKVAH